MTIDDLYTLLGSDVVLLPLPYGKKAPAKTGWQKTTFSDTNADDYQASLKNAIKRGGNIGVLLGTPSGCLIAIDIDNDADIEPFLEANPELRHTLRTKGRRGCQLWLRMKQGCDYPLQVKKLSRLVGEIEAKFGEWRSNGGQSVIFGEHPDGGRYSILVDKPPMEVSYSEIKWSQGVTPPHVAKKAIAQVRHGIPGVNGDLTTLNVRGLATRLGLNITSKEHDKITFRCPFETEHSTPNADRDAALFFPSAGHKIPTFTCFHVNSCGNRGIEEFLAWAETQSPGIVDQHCAKKGKPNLILPSDTVPFEDCGEQLFPVLADTKKFFLRGDQVVELTEGGSGAGLRVLEPSDFQCRLEQHFNLLGCRQLEGGKTAIVPKRCTLSTAMTLLSTSAVRRCLPSVNIITASPIFADVDGQMQILGKGYHDVLGGVLVMKDRQILEIPLEEALLALLDLFKDFDFVSPSDKSRAVASLMSPALRFGGLLPYDFPMDLAEANESQSGKTFRQKLVATVYGEEAFVVNKSDHDKGVGSLSEFVSEGLLSGRPFLMLENVRQNVSCQLLESAIRGVGTVNCRTAYRRSQQVDTSRVVIMLSSNKAEVTTDLANRSVICRIRKQPRGYRFAAYPEGDVMAHVKANTDYYLSCIHAVLRQWFAEGKPRMDTSGHDFREWCQTLDWIVQNLFALPSLMDGHDAEQARISNPFLGWLREVALAVEKSGRLDEKLRSNEILDACDTHFVDLYCAGKAMNDDQRLMLVGKNLKRIFLETNEVVVGGFKVTREQRDEYNGDSRRYGSVFYHVFSQQKSAPREEKLPKSV